jgi:hypothetical protein
MMMVIGLRPVAVPAPRALPVHPARRASSLYVIVCPKPIVEIAFHTRIRA